MKPIIHVSNLQKEFVIKQKSAGFVGGVRSIFKPDLKHVKAVDDISFTVNEGEILALIGPNGAGKSTTIKMLTGILFPSGGEIRVLGFDPAKDRKKLAMHIGSVFGQKPQLWYHLPPIDTYSLFSKIYEMDPTEYQERLNFLVEAFEIRSLLKTPVRKLSLGQRMRCEIVAAMLHKPKIIFLDEPTIGLDIIAKQQIRRVITFLNEKEKATIFLTSHDAGDIEVLAQRSIVINFGKVIFDDSTEQLKKNYIKTKVIELVVEGSTEHFAFPGAKILERTPYDIKVELDLAQGSIDKLLAYAVNTLNIRDINIFDPPMEEIIADIYRKKQA